MKKTIYLIIILMLISNVSANTLIPVSYQVSVDFQGERDFRLIMPNGYERHFYWDNDTTYSDTTFQHTIYHNLDEDKWCTDYKDKISQYENISGGISSMLNICSNLVSRINRSEELVLQIDEAKDDRREYERLFEACNQNFLNEKNESDECNIDIEELREDYDICNRQVNSYKSSSSGCVECETELQKLKGNKNSSALLFLGIGLGIGYYLWGRKKKKSAPSEQSEGSYGGDGIRDRSEEPGIYDGPKQ